jgi:hypothetical protein
MGNIEHPTSNAQVKKCPTYGLECHPTMHAAERKIPPGMKGTVIKCGECDSWHLTQMSMKPKGRLDELGRPLRWTRALHRHD